MFTLQTLPAEPEAPRREVAESSGFSLHAGIAAKASQRDKLERRVFEPASPDRARVVPRTRAAVASECGEASVTDRQRALTWAQRLKRVFALDIQTCRPAGGAFV